MQLCHDKIAISKIFKIDSWASASRNTAKVDGGGIFNSGTLNLNGGSISSNTVTSGSGGGIYVPDFGSVTFDGTEITVKYNKAALPDSETKWYQGWGAYSGVGEPIMTGGFDPAKQVTDNTQYQP